jgi:transposase
MSRSTALTELRRPIARRRSWSLKEKVRIIEESRLPGSSVAAVARRHSVSTQQVYNWRRQCAQGPLGAGRYRGAQLIEVRVRERASLEAAPGRRVAAEGRIEITLADGVRIAFSGAVGAERLEEVLGVLRR